MGSVSVKTDRNDYGTLKLNLKAGKYKIQSICGKFKNTNTVQVKK